MSIPTSLCPRKPMETQSRSICDAITEDSSVFVSALENCVVSLFVRIFTSLLVSAQIKMTIQSGAGQAQSTRIVSFHEEE